MRNKIVGILIIIVAVLIGFIIFLFNRALTSIVDTACQHGPSCPMWGTIKFQTNIGIGIMALIIIIGLYLIFFGKEEKIVTKIKTVTQQIGPKDISKKNYRKVMTNLNSDEKNTFEKIIESNGTIFQSELIEKLGFSKVKVSRILDRLEGMGLIERKRRGMTNIIILKH